MVSGFAHFEAAQIAVAIAVAFIFLAMLPVKVMVNPRFERTLGLK